MELTFKRRSHYGITVWESNETVTDMGIEFPRFRIVKEQDERDSKVIYVVRELQPDKGNGYNYSVNTVAENKLKDTIYWLNTKLHRI